MTSEQPLPGRVAAIDFGTKRIGIAVCDAERRIASPFGMYARRSAQADALFFRQFVESESIAEFVVGLPFHLSGDESPMSLAARTFGLWLQNATGLPVHFVDERFSTVEADQLLNERGLSRKKKASRRDPLAAQAILKAYLGQL